MKRAEREDIPVWLVMGWNPVQMSWTVRSRHDDEAEAVQHAEALHRKDRVRVRVRPGVKRVLQVKAPINNQTRAWRFEQAGRMSDLADANKRYKSPG
jgi:hypothetical protein